MAVTLVLGGARSGKSGFAERYVARLAVRETGEPPVWFLATAEARDNEMADRIAQHRKARPLVWKTLEEPLRVTHALDGWAAAPRPPLVLIDCLSLLLSNWMEAEWDPELETDALVAALAQYPERVTVVSNEVGSGIVPGDALSRRYRDALGRLNQRVASVADAVYLMVAGIPWDLRQASEAGDPLK